jgi:hypothetical protein
MKISKKIDKFFKNWNYPNNRGGVGLYKILILNLHAPKEFFYESYFS